ncbi:beta-hydroxyacyl-ACP dehydratase [Halalkalibacterium halodurans]|uniref:3-hydroxyacyl-ACP dehydratase FabZ family protein n=1 Tax=Halalkalibacterium halodurans TaxID=86665 RepID=UPI0010688F92|nr:3-hydroxyacyl-ACP dehydratase FabZ family protein [Halalkalibacterium halodurans]TES55756.1 beta-hydroxyacyl-ACP dehydratase [Halalkalibacterium halodurans]
MDQNLSYEQVRSLLPQKHPFIFIDTVEQIEPDNRIVCVKNLTGNEWYVPGHFPDQTVFPGVLLVEAMAQSGILLYKLSQEDISSTEKQQFLLSGVKVRFLNPAVPGNQIRIETEYVKMTANAGIVTSTGWVGESKIAKADITLAISNK